MSNQSEIVEAMKPDLIEFKKAYQKALASLPTTMTWEERKSQAFKEAESSAFPGATQFIEAFVGRLKNGGIKENIKEEEWSDEAKIGNRLLLYMAQSGHAVKRQNGEVIRHKRRNGMVSKEEVGEPEWVSQYSRVLERFNYIPLDTVFAVLFNVAERAIGKARIEWCAKNGYTFVLSVNGMKKEKAEKPRKTVRLTAEQKEMLKALLAAAE